MRVVAHPVPHAAGQLVTQVGGKQVNPSPTNEVGSGRVRRLADRSGGVLHCCRCAQEHRRHLCATSGGGRSSSCPSWCATHQKVAVERLGAGLPRLTTPERRSLASLPSLQLFDLSHNPQTSAAEARQVLSDRLLTLMERRHTPSLPSSIGWKTCRLFQLSARRMRCHAVSSRDAGGAGDLPSSPVSRLRGGSGEDEGVSGAGTEKSPLLLNIPTLLTLCRVAAIPALLSVYFVQEPWAAATGAVIFLAASVTDWLDGFLARRMGTSSAFGAFLDPVADKLMVATVLVLLCSRPPPTGDLAVFPWLLPLPSILIIGREITMSAVREWAASQGGKMRQAVAVNNLGKWKTATQMAALTLLLAIRDHSLGPLVSQGFAIGTVCLYVSAGLAAWSLVVYMKGIMRALVDG